MEYRLKTIDCAAHFPATHRKRPFRVARLAFDASGNAADCDLLRTLIEKGRQLSEKVHRGAANFAHLQRTTGRVHANCMAGILAEFGWKHFLNELGRVARVAETPFGEAAHQIDLLIPATGKTIEVRASFPRNGIPFALCHPHKCFDVIGPYSNHYKPGEPQKDFYVRTLFHLSADGGSGRPFEEVVRQPGFTIWLTGGATWEMMTDAACSREKTFIPEGEINPERLAGQSDYRVVPFHRALDTVEIFHHIKNAAL